MKTRMPTHKQQLKDPRWDEKRRKIGERDNWTCQRCGARRVQLEVHHTEYIEGRWLWEYPDEMLVMLCDPCHEVEHEKWREAAAGRGIFILEHTHEDLKPGTRLARTSRVLRQDHHERNAVFECIHPKTKQVIWLDWSDGIAA